MFSIAQSLFKASTPEKILKKNIYDFRQKADDAEFHFIIGVAMMQLGFLKEAYMAFSKARDIGNLPKSQLFLCIALMHAERFDECREETKKISWTALDSSQISVFIEILERTGLPAENIIRYFETKYSESEDLKDRIVITLHNLSHGKPADISEFNATEFFSEEDYLVFLDDCHTAGASSENIWPLLAKIPITKINAESVIKTMVSTRSLLSMPDKEREKWAQRIDLGAGIRSRIEAVMYEVEEERKNEKKMEEHFRTLISLYDAGAREKTAMLTIAAHFLKHFSEDKIAKVRDIMVELVQMDGDNMLFRKNLHELLLKTGEYSAAEQLDRASIAIRMRQDRELFDMIKAFHRFYGNEPCPLSGDGRCPLCFGTEERPAFKAVCANVAPREIYAKKVVSQKISVDDEDVIKKIFEWQPLYVASPIVAEYMRGLGGYPATRAFPDVLVDGETYVFIRLKKEALARLVNEGYSVSQIDPMYHAVFPAHKPSALAAASLEDKDVENYRGVVSANDFVIEIIKAISPEIETQENENKVK